ncbi:glycosyl hydrolase family 18 protein [Deinococcus roseus]|uniref:chitinase n=1 Tax=Deinococcus roseus TaxID=392414 RepID=A0ABQ2CT78_9DEIO|nr:glycosyl hydrolase family 18 protein [Deinococcus roseus]GGJ18643.1 hypothetical protein GCM10008938_00920 [Deinococcus roseus]
MKKHLWLGSSILLGLGATACNPNTGPKDTTPPTVTLTAPKNVSAASIVKITVNAADASGIAKVELFRNGEKLLEDTTAPYEFSQAFTVSSQNGNYTYTAKATDKNGIMASSASTTTTVILPRPEYRHVAYFTNWAVYGPTGYKVKDIDTSGAAASITHINYAFGNVNQAGECAITDAWADYQKPFDPADSVDGTGETWGDTLRGHFAELKKLKAKYPKIKVMISLGGWTLSKWFSDAAATDAGRKKLASSCIDLFIKGNLPLIDKDVAGGPGSGAGIFDGIDIDWEYPGGGGDPGNVVRPEDKENFTLLLNEFRAQLDTLSETTSKHYLLTIAAPAAPSKIAQTEPDKYQGALDFINLMAYDFRGGWAATGPTNFHSNLYASPNDPMTDGTEIFSVETTVKEFQKYGIPNNKLVVGIPYYGQGWKGVANVNNGLYQTATESAGTRTYRELKDFGPRFDDPISKQMWAFDGSTFWTFDDEKVIQEKARYIRSLELGGTMVWSLDGDDAQATLSKTIHSSLK